MWIVIVGTNLDEIQFWNESNNKCYVSTDDKWMNIENWVKIQLNMEGRSSHGSRLINTIDFNEPSY